MYSSRGGNAYGQQQQQQQQQQFASQSAYSQSLGPGYSKSSVGGPAGGSQMSMASRHSSMLGGPKESDIAGYRGQPSAGAHYGGQYSSLYGSSALTSGQQVPGMSAKGAGPSALEGRSGYGSTMPDSPKLTSADYVSSSGYGHKTEKLFSDKISDYPSLERHQYSERQNAFVGRETQTVPTGRYGDSINSASQHQRDVYDRMDQASLLRQEQILKAQSLQSASLDGGSRQADYLAARGASIRHQSDLYAGRMDADPRSLSMLGASSFAGQLAPSILGAAPRGNVEDLLYAQSSSNPGYGVSLPPGRDYATGKGLQGASFDSDYQGSLLSRGGHSRIDERKDDRGGFARELERREEERRREHLRDREKDREREKERERERERDRERKRERERERERILERRVKERDRERERVPEIRRGPETRRDRTPPRISRERAERRGTSLSKDVRPARRDSPRPEALHRRHSPVKEKRREYDCKVYSSSLVASERDYLSLDKRYPRLFISPECSKIVVNWPRENLRLPFRTPISFEHDFVEEDTGAEQKQPPPIVAGDQPVKSASGNTVWNAKMILMSGLSQNALEELSSEKSYDSRVPHFCNILRFAVLKKDHSLMAIGGPWDSVDGGNPSLDDSALVRTVLRFAKDTTQLDLENCRHWNRFLEIHYDRVGKDGLFSHKEVTILYVPDLSDCLPSLEAWRDQWLAHKKAIAERGRQLALKKEKSAEHDRLKDKDQKDNREMKEGGENEKSEKNGGVVEGEEGNNVEKKDLGDSAGIPTASTGKSVKKKIIKKIVKQKVADKKDGPDDPTKQSDKPDEKNVGEIVASAGITVQQVESSAVAASVKTFVRKRVVKKVPVAKVVQKENEVIMQPEVKTETDKGSESSEAKPEVKSDLTGADVVQDATVKKTAKRKVIKRVPKRKVTVVEANEGLTGSKKDDDKDAKLDQAGNEAKKTLSDQIVAANSHDVEVKAEKKSTMKTSKSATPEKQDNEAKKTMGDQTVAANSHVVEVKTEKKSTLKKSKTATPEKLDDLGNSSKTASKADKEEDKDEKRVDEKTGSASKMDNVTGKQKASNKDNLSGKREKSKEREISKGEEKKDKGKDNSRSKSNKELKEKKHSEEPPRHPGLLLQTKGSKDSKLNSLSLSLDSLLNYTDKDIEESTFELSLFAESLYEMLQYQMGCRLSTFFQKLRIKFVLKRNQRKRQREELSKGSDKKSSAKRVKTDGTTVEAKSTNNEAQDAAHQEDGSSIVKEEDTNVDSVENAKTDDEVEEDPEEDPEEDEDMLDASPQHDMSNEENDERGKIDADIKTENLGENEKDKEQETDKDLKTEKVLENAKDKEQEPAKEASGSKPISGSESKQNLEKVDTEEKETLLAVDKELLQAFRFFDRNRVGYVRVEDMRLIIHNLGMFLSYRDVKELVQIALMESNTGRDDRILYDKLVRMPVD